MAKLKIYRTVSGERYGVLSGGATNDYDIPNPSYFESAEKNSGDTRDWVANHEYAWSFKRVRIAEDVTAIGNYCFAFFENADFSFENPANMQHLGKWAFACSGIRGKVTLSGLQDDTLAEAFSGCSKLAEVDLSGSAVRTIGDKAFMRCHSLRRVSGCGQVHTVGERAFLRCASLRSIDLKPTVLRTVGATAFHITSVGTRLDGFRNTNFGVCSRRTDKFTAQALAEIRAVELPDVGGVPDHVCEQSYPDLPYAKDTAGNQRYMHDGCMMLSVYHAVHGWFGGKQCADFAEWWAAVGAAYSDANEDKVLSDIQLNFAAYDMTMLHEVADLLGMKCKNFSAYALHYGNDDEALMTHDATAKREIRQALMAGYPVLASISTSKMQTDASIVTFPSSHDVAIVGCRNGKLIVVDSTSIDGEQGGVYEVAYEDLFLGGMPDADGSPMDYNAIRVLVPKGVNT